MMKTPKMRCRVPKKIERNRKKNTMRCFVIKKMEKEMEGLIKLKISKGSQLRKQSNDRKKMYLMQKKKK